MLTEEQRARAVADLRDAAEAIREAVPGSIEEATALALASVALAALTPRPRYGRLAS